MALTNDESAVLRSIAGQLSRDDPRLARSLSRSLEAQTPCRPLRPVMIGLLLAVTALLIAGVWLRDPAPLILAVTWGFGVPAAACVARRRGWW